MSTVSRGNKGEEKVISTLKRIKVNHHVFNNVTFISEKSEMTHQIDHILVHPHGVFVIETKNYFGEIIANTNEGYWKKIIKGKEEIIRDPLKQNKSHVRVVKKILKDVDVISVVVFVKNNAPYFGDENVINLKDLLLFIDSYPYKKILEKEEITEICKKIRENKTKIKKSEHLENISYLKQIKKENMAEIEYAIENQKCPRCGSNILQNGYNFKCSNCDFKFKL